MAKSISLRRITKRLGEIFEDKIDMSDLPERERNEDHYMTRALAALALIMKCGLDADSSCLHMTDGYNDIGIDSIYLDEAQKQLLLVQSKLRKDGKGSISNDEMHTFVAGVKRILNLNLDGANQKINAKLQDIDEAISSFNYQIKAVFIHTGQKSGNYSFQPMKELCNQVNDEENTLLLFEEITANEIYSFLAKGQESEEISLDDVMLSNWGKITEPYAAYYGTVSAATIGKWYKEHCDRLFAKNIRFYKGSTSVNEGMEKVLKQEPENFIYYNNGIKILCKAVYRKAKESTSNDTGLFKLDGVSLVNGAQTTGTIGKVYISNPEQISKARVMLQIIDLSQASEETAVQITKLSNTQNRIENQDFASLDPVQEKIRQELSFEHFSYLYKSGDKMTDPSCQLTFEEAIVAMACLNGDISYSTTAKRNVGALTEDITKAPYKVLINPSINTYELLNGVMVVRYVDKALQAKKALLSGKEKLVTIHGNRFIAYCVLQKVKKENSFFEKNIYGEQLWKQINEIVDRLINLIKKSIDELYPESYPANVFKNVTKCKAIFERIKNGGLYN